MLWQVQCLELTDQVQHACIMCYWTVQAGLSLLTFTWHCLSPLAAFSFTCGVNCSNNGRWWQRIRKVYSASFMGIFEGLWSECIWQQAITCCSCYSSVPKAIFPCTCDLLVSQKIMQTLFFHPSSPFAFNFCKCNRSSISTVCNSRFNFRC